MELEKECRKLVRKKKSVLKCTSLEDLRKFKWSKLMKEWLREAPTLYKVLRTIAVPPQLGKRKMQYLRPIIGAAGAMLFKARNAQMSAVEYLVGLSFFSVEQEKRFVLRSFTCYIIAVVKNTTSILPVYRIFDTGL